MAEAYLCKFELVSLHNGWDEEGKAMQLAATLEGSAVEVLGDAQSDFTYEELKSALMARFDPASHGLQHKAALQCRRKAVGETMRSTAEH